MNKYLAFVALALAVAVATANPVPEIEDVESQFTFTPTNDEETAQLEGKAAAFSDFCISTRDYVIGDIKTRSDGKAASLFNVFFSGAENLGLEAVNVQKEAAERLGNQIRNPMSPIAPVDSSNEVDMIIADGQRKIQENPNAPRGMLQGFMSALSATRSMVANRVMEQLNNLKAGFGVAAIIGGLKDVCELVDEYDQEVHTRFLAARDELAAADASLASMTFENVPCVTAKRVVRLDGICKLAIAAQGPLTKAYRAQ